MLKNINDNVKAFPSARLTQGQCAVPREEPDREMEKRKKESNDDAVVLEGRFKVLRGRI
jgi:hypothetical protein